MSSDCFIDCNDVIAILTVKKSIEVATETMKIMLKNSGELTGISFGFGQYRSYSFEFRPSVILVKRWALLRGHRYVKQTRH